MSAAALCVSDVFVWFLSAMAVESVMVVAPDVWVGKLFLSKGSTCISCSYSCRCRRVDGHTCVSRAGGADQ